MRRGINVKEQSRKKNDDIRDREKRMYRRRLGETGTEADIKTAAGTALLSAYVSPAHLLTLLLLDSVSSVQPSSA